MNFVAKLIAKRKKAVKSRKKKKDKKKKVKKKKETKKTVKKEERKLGVFVSRPRLNAISKLFFIIIKNIKIILRSKVSALLFILGPLLIVFLIALAFNTSTLYDLNVAVYSESYSTMSNGIVDNLSTSQYNVIKMESETDCIDSVKFDDFQVCVVFPSNMILDNSGRNVIKIYVDNSRLNIAHLISSQISSKVYVSAEELSEGMVSNILIVLDTVNTEAVQSQATVTNLNTLNEEAASEASSASSEITNIDLSYSAVDTTTIDTALSEIKSDYNMSDTEVSDLTSAISSLESQYNSLADKASTASTSLESSSSDLSSVKSNLASEAEKIAKIEESINTMVSSIDTIKITNVENIVTPVRTSIEPISSSNSYLLYIIPSILMMIFMLVGLLLSSSNIISEKKSLAYFRNFITPTNDFLFIIGQFLSIILLIILEIVIVMGTLYYFVPEPGVYSYLLAGLVLLLIATLFIFTGMIIGHMLNTKETVILAAVSLAIILLFFSNTILPLETLSTLTRSIVFYNPFVLGESILKKILLFNSGFKDISFMFYHLVGFTVAVFIGAIVTRYVFKRFYSS